MATSGRVLAAVVFLDLNGIRLDQPTDALYKLTMGVAEGRLDKAAVTAGLRRIAMEKT
jgi:prophage maintenance system killer protein